jgi:hypothetical protein
MNSLLYYLLIPLRHDLDLEALSRCLKRLRRLWSVASLLPLSAQQTQGQTGWVDSTASLRSPLDGISRRHRDGAMV